MTGFPTAALRSTPAAVARLRRGLRPAAGRVAASWRQGTRRPTPAVWRLRLALVSALLALMAFVQQPRFVSRDTKLDLYVDPVDFMRRAMSLWDPRNSFGELANQSYGYLFPMGPYYALTQVMQMPDWVAQRLWLSALMVVGFLGVVKLATLLDIGRPWARVLAGLAFVLSPRMVTVLGPISSEALPFVLTPWVLVPLVRYYHHPRKAAALSALAVLAAGGVNATATAALLPLPVLYLLTREAGAHRRRVAAWWAGAVAMATFWWVVPLFVLGAYSFPFLDYIESATVTTSVTSLTETVRGNSHWINHFAVAGQPWWRGGAWLTSAPLLYAETLAVAALGLAGLAARGLRERAFLVLGLLAGLVLVAVGYAGAGGSVVADPVVDLLDGVLAPLRNVHKFDGVLRLPLVLGLAHLVSRATVRSLRPSLAVAAAATVLGASYPFLAASALPDGGYLAVPGYWQEAADWLAEEGPDDRSLLAPASGFGQYTWGRPMDEPMQPLARAPWAVRNQIPLSSEGNIRALDAIESRLSDGVGSSALSDYLARAGVRFVVVRNDLDWPWTGSTRPIRVHQALEQAGLPRVATFGPGVAADRSAGRQVSDRGADPLYPAIEVFEVPGYGGPVRALSGDAEVRLTGGPEGVLQAMESGLLGRRHPVVLEGDPEGGSTAPVVVTDGMRRRERNLGEVVDNGSATLTAGQGWVTRRAAHDYVPFDGIPSSVARWPDGTRATASSSASDADTVLLRGSEHHPGAAVDGNPGSTWVTGTSGSPLAQWWELRLARPRVLPAVTVTVADLSFYGTRVTDLEIRTDTGTVTAPLLAGRDTVQVDLPAGATRTVRISAAASVVAAEEPGPWGLAEVELDGSGVTPVPRAVVAATPTDGAAFAVSLARSPGDRAGCVRTLRHAACSPSLARVGEEAGAFDRFVATGSLLRPRMSGTAVPMAGAELDRLLDDLLVPSQVRVTATSRLTVEPGNRPGAAMDSDPVTGWVASPTDADPALTLTFASSRTVSRLTLTSPEDFVASRPRTVVVEGGGEVRRVQVGSAGALSFAPITGSQLTLRFPDPDPVYSTNPSAGSALEILPVGVAEVTVPGLRSLGPRTQEPWAAPCLGPVVTVDGRPVATTVSGVVGDLAQRRPLRLEACGTLEPMGEGTHRLATEPSAAFALESLALADQARPLPTATERAVAVRSWGATERVLDVRAGRPALLVVAENFNRGWTATVGGRELRPVRVDGWQQGWRLPAAAGRVTLEFQPDRLYRAGLVVGAVLALAVVVLAALPAGARPTRWARSRPSRVASRLVLAGGVVSGVLLVGWWALPAGAVAAAAARLGPASQARARLALVAGLAVSVVAVLGLVGGRGPGAASGPFGLAAQLLVAVAVAAVVASATGASSRWAGRRRGRQDLARNAGRSTRCQDSDATGSEMASSTTRLRQNPPPNSGVPVSQNASGNSGKCQR